MAKTETVVLELGKNYPLNTLVQSAESDLEEIAESMSVGEAICTQWSTS
jgi:hypothetical protein